MNVGFVLLLASLIVIFGYFSELIFKKMGIPDTLFLIILGFFIGPGGLNYIKPESLSAVAPLLITITLVFLLFDGGLTIDLKSFAEGLGPGITIAVFNFLISAILISGIFLLAGFQTVESMMVGFCLGGVSSAFIIPVLKKVQPRKQVYSILTLESAVTDVLAIVLALTMIELDVSSHFQLKNVLSQIATLFAVAGMIGTAAGFLWIYLEQKFVEKDRYYLVTISYVFLVYLLVEYLKGNGAIAALFLGMILANSKLLVELLNRIRRKKIPAGRLTSVCGIDPVVTRQERMFYDEISFFLKTFFFVYIGLSLDVKNIQAVALGIAIAGLLMFTRKLSSLFLRALDKKDRFLVNSLFARGIASAVIILMAIRRGLDPGSMVIDTVYMVITATIVLSSIRVYFYNYRMKKIQSANKKSA